MNFMILVVVLMGCFKRQSSIYVEQTQLPLNQLKEVNGFVDKHQIDEEIRRHASQIYSCYAKPYYKSPSSTPRIVVEFVILTEDGSVADAKAVEDSVGLVKIRECILSVFMKMQFPSGMVSDIANDKFVGPEGEVGVRIRYPLVFASR